LVDVVGYYSDSGTTYTPTSPARVIDTRSGGGSPLGSSSTRTVQVTGVQGIPSSAVSVVTDVTTVAGAGSASSYLTLFPAGAATPTASSMNYYTNETLTKEVTVKLSSGGALTVFNGPSGSTHFLIDVVGYYTADASGLSYTPINPTRYVDTRSGTGQPYSGQPIGDHATKTFTIGSSVMPANAAAVVNNMTQPTATVGSGATYLTAFPANVATVPGATSITWVSPIAFSQSTVSLSSGPSGGFKVYNNVGTSDAIIDALGYYY
jgi:hypothetical protein